MFGSFSEESIEAAKNLLGFAERRSVDDLKCNQPKMEHHGDKKAVVKSCFKKGGKRVEKLIRFGDANMTTAGPPKEGESEEQKERRRSFKARHAANIARGPESGAYWADKFLWSEQSGQNGQGI